MKTFQVTGIGNAMVDVLSTVSDTFLAEHDVQKGIMQLIDAERAVALYGSMGPATEVSGGSAANTIAGFGMLGGRTAYVGKVKDDQLGRIFAHDIRSLGVIFDTPMTDAHADGDETGRCIVLVTPDGERSMNTYLGVSADLSAADVDEGMMADTEWLYLEGYRFDGEGSKQAFAKAIAATKAAGGKVSVTLSDPFCIERHRADFKRMIREDIDLLFANEHELTALYEVPTVEEAIKAAQAELPMTACTLGPKGVCVVTPEEIFDVPAAPMPRVDVTGAGDLFAAGFFYGLTHDHGLVKAGQMGCMAAGEVIGHIGARPQQDLKALFAGRGLM